MLLLFKDDGALFWMDPNLGYSDPDARMLEQDNLYYNCRQIVADDTCGAFFEKHSRTTSYGQLCCTKLIPSL
eukprot:SAG31_NODE_595_length_13695_cov_11.446896_6_plen_72_part_00